MSVNKTAVHNQLFRLYQFYGSSDRGRLCPMKAYGYVIKIYSMFDRQNTNCIVWTNICNTSIN